MMTSRAGYELCVLSAYGLEPISYARLGETVGGSKGCYLGPRAYRAPGYLEGRSFWAILHRFGSEVVYDFASMERANFSFYGAGVNAALDLGVGAQAYVGLPMGFRSDDYLMPQYRGVSSAIQAGISGDAGVGFGAGGGSFISSQDPMVRGNIAYVGVSLSADLLEGVDFDILPTVFYFPDSTTLRLYAASTGALDIGALVSDILTGNQSPLSIHLSMGTGDIYISTTDLVAPRAFAAAMALNYARAYADLR